MSNPFSEAFYEYQYSRSGVGGRTPPDVTNYVDLSIYDLTDYDIVKAMIGAGQLALPGWNPNEGNIEVLLIELFGYAVAEQIAATNRIPGAVVQAILQMVDIQLDYGAPPTADAVILFSDPLGHSIPAGTRFYLTTDRNEYVTFLLEDPGASANYNETAAVCTLVGDTFTAAANGMLAGTMLYPADNLPFIDAVRLTSPVVDGRDPETDADWRARGVARLSRLSDVLVVPRQFELAARERPEVSRAVGVDNYDPASANYIADDWGHVTVAVLGDGSATLSDDEKAQIQTDLSYPRSASMLKVHVVDVDVVRIDVAIAVHPYSTQNEGDVLEAVRLAVIDYLDPITWAYGATVRHNELVALADRVVGVDWVGNVTMMITGSGTTPTTGDLTLTTPISLPHWGTVTITRTA